MKYESTRKEFLAEKLEVAIPQIAELLDRGFQVEVCRSRSGIKLYYYKKQYKELKGGSVND